ncbi:unnamed protein product [Amaranthus hypochondriacus]
MADYINLAIKSLSHAILASTLSIIIFLTLKQHKKRTKLPQNNDENKRVPPGDMGLPWIGETMEFYKALQKNRLFEDFIRPRIQTHGKTFKTRLMGSPTIVVNGADAARFFLSNEFKLVVSSWPSSSVQLMGRNSIMEKTGEKHRLIRSIMAPCLGNSSLEYLVPNICGVISSHLVEFWGGNIFQEGRTIYLYKTAKYLIFKVICECLLEMEVEEELFEKFEKVLEGVFAPVLNVPGTSFWRAKNARKDIEKVLVGVVRKKREEMEGKMEGNGGETTSLLAKLVGGLIRGEISEVEVIDNMVLLIFAAHDTTSFAIAMLFKMLAQNPHCYSMLLQEHIDITRNKRKEEKLTMDDVMKMKYTWQFAREVMRLNPPVFGSFRRAICDIKFDGFTIPKGWKVLWTAYGTHLNEEYFKDAMKFEPNRFEEAMPPYVYVPFGGGPRVCAGYQLAKLNILIFVHLVVTQYNWSLLQPDEPIVMNPLPFPSQGMPITISPKHCLYHI